MDLDIRVEGDGEHRTVHLSGSGDLASVPALREALQPLRPPEVTRLVLDVSELTHLDSTSLGVVLGALRRLREGTGDLVIRGARGPVLSLIRVVGLDRVVHLEG
ncbi:MAG: STAS domain-containing protein [Candidatus Binatia bacterium]